MTNGIIYSTSKIIADYVIQNGVNPYSASGAQRPDAVPIYTVTAPLKDGSFVDVTFVDTSGYGTSNPLPNCRLEITHRGSDVYVNMQENGLTGELHWAKYFKPKDGHMDQKSYEALLEEVRLALSGK